MNRMRPFLSALPTILAALCCASAYAAQRERIDDDWHFRLGDVADAQLTEHDDNHWPQVRLPHDWSIGLSRSADEPSAGGGGFFPTGVGWYRRQLHCVPTAGERTWLVFDGVYRNATVWLNGEQLGGHAYGYTPFRFEITNRLSADEPNLLAVRVDNSAQPNSRWYTGSGIYRHVWLERRPTLSIDPQSCVASVDTLEGRQCTLSTSARVEQTTPQETLAELRVELFSPDGEVVASHTEPIRASRGKSAETHQKLVLSNPRLWSPDDPALYTVRYLLLSDGKEVDRHESSFGIRTIEVTADRGLLLNGKPVALFGGNVHHDNGCLGAAAFDRAEQRKAGLLKEAGYNAVRTAHNPPSPAFLDACDRLGLLVIDEAFDCWAKKKVAHDYHEDFAENWRADLAAMVRRDRHHPSVIMWSIGNEMYERGADHAPDLAGEMVAVVRELDPTRPVTAGVNGLGPQNWSKLDRLFGELDVAGYNYEQGRYADDHQRVPDRVMYASESYLSDLATSRDHVSSRPYVVGDFVWSAIDYLGEAGIGRNFPPGATVTPHWEGTHYPYHGALCGDIDITGVRRPISHFREIVWDRGERLSVAVVEPAPDGGAWQPSQWATEPLMASWTWPGHEGRDLQVKVASRWPTVRVELNGQVVGEVTPSGYEDGVATLSVRYAPGEVTAIGLDEQGRAQQRMVLTTAGPAESIRLTPDRTDLVADGQDLSFVAVEIVDADGLVRPDADHQVTYTIDGPGTIVGVGSGDLSSDEPYNALSRRVFHGRALVVVRSDDDTGTITLTASAPGLPAAELELSSR
ncbi:Beta-galactosidase [Posidoniimonas corsicana]|uniref:Beta-galactosidase n=1 Tax=Posidoniimonas corsicana TaxID=1938618 RepID=A0A5C5UVW9_9BACT|nr:glycoside hydrolase family 2 TIM barrel-domain containing protein [Posidoniimonas corsicana]TWT29763.1 Beta-galactosidase [Posidoniimonas corsicana]